MTEKELQDFTLNHKRDQEEEEVSALTIVTCIDNLAKKIDLAFESDIEQLSGEVLLLEEEILGEGQCHKKQKLLHLIELLEAKNIKPYRGCKDSNTLLAMAVTKTQKSN